MKKVKKYLKVSAILTASALLFSSCATLFTKSSYPISIYSTPDKAKVSITDKKGKEVYLGNTPAIVKLKAGAGFFSRAEYQVRLSSSGYDDKVIPVQFKLDGWYFGNILVGGFLGMLIIDPATGAMWKIDNDYINEALNQSSASIDTPQMNILDIQEIPENWKKHLVRLD